ncbi:MAG TPA: PxKF domain-containing protein [Gemmatimonadaceae bacterium]|nr:PxKF domain-containing protein [Gemmatimonadaceae bacterium]
MTRRSARSRHDARHAFQWAPAIFAALVGLAACSDAPQPTGLARPGRPAFVQVATGPVITSTADPGDGTCDDAGTGDGCTLREAIVFAAPGATITFAPGVTGTITLTAGQLDIDKGLTITGPGARSLAVNGNNSGRVFDVKSGVGPVALAGLTITGGTVVGSLGGGIANSGTLTLTRCTVTGNNAIDGGGIDNEGGTLTVVESTVSGNHASGYGGGIFSETNSDLSSSSTTILNSTISGNTADAGGGVTIYNGLTRVLHSTITANRAVEGGGLWSFGDVATRADVEGSIVAGNTTDGPAPNDAASNGTSVRYRSLGYNVVGAAGTNVDFTLEFNQTGDQTGVTDQSVLELGALADNGGPTNTHAVLAGSAASDKGDPAFDPNAFTPPLDTDQRGTGFARVSGGRVDVGAFERQVTLFPFTGFFQPVDNPGPNDDVVNRAKAGQAIAVKFALGGNQGLAIFRAGYPKFVSEPCDRSGAMDDIEATTTSPAGLTYDPATQQYTYVWKTDKAWAGKCGTFELGLTDDSNHHALFRFVR